ncbi:hypothetical protein ACVBIL_01770 [Shewanella sp. 125m-7]
MPEQIFLKVSPKKAAEHDVRQSLFEGNQFAQNSCSSKNQSITASDYDDSSQLENDSQADAINENDTVINLMNNLHPTSQTQYCACKNTVYIKESHHV